VDIDITDLSVSESNTILAADPDPTEESQSHPEEAVETYSLSPSFRKAVEAKTKNWLISDDLEVESQPEGKVSSYDTVGCTVHYSVG